MRTLLLVSALLALSLFLPFSYGSSPTPPPPTPQPVLSAPGGPKAPSCRMGDLKLLLCILGPPPLHCPECSQAHGWRQWWGTWGSSERHAGSFSGHETIESWFLCPPMSLRPPKGSKGSQPRLSGIYALQKLFWNRVWLGRGSHCPGLEGSGPTLCRGLRLGEKEGQMGEG